ncbi:MAG: helix-turn-helix transcriptional regulator [Ruminococcaceae bacterium]|nr:helix-turn-helix transcriptional regulator [Oscillospiraceae bacterium]
MTNALNDNIRMLRQQNGLNQVEFARIMNVTKQCVSNWENDNVVPSVDMLLKLAEYFRVSTDYLLGLEKEKIINATGLTDEQFAHVSMLVRDLEIANKK